MVEILSVIGKFDAHNIRTVVCFLLGNSAAYEFYMPTFRNTLFHVGVFIREKAWLEPNLFPYKYSNSLNLVIFHTYPPKFRNVGM
jgi:hypothetical protein